MWSVMTQQTGAALRVVLVTEQTLVSELVARSISSDQLEASVVGRDVAAMDALCEVYPSVVVVDVTGAGRASARRLLADVAAHAPEAHVLVLTDQDDEGTLTEAFAAGADGYLTSSASLEELERAVRMLAGGWPVVTPAQLLRVLRGEAETGTRPRKPVAATLTGREREVLRRLAHGASTMQMAVELGIAVPTVRSHVQSVLTKLGVHSKLEAAARATTLQLV